MVRICQLVLGPAGSGKSTYCAELAKYLQATRREVHLVNFDPAAEALTFTPDVDVRDLVKLSDVTAYDPDTGEIGLGPNGGLVFCVEHLVDNLPWLHDALLETNSSDDAYFVIDFPGQIELYTHVQAMQTICKNLKSWDYRVGVVFIIDACMISGDAAKYLSGILLATSAMIHLSLPWLNVLSKMDLLVGEQVHDDDDEHHLYEEGDVLEKLCRVDLSWVRDSFQPNSSGIKPGRKRKPSRLDMKWYRLNAVLCDMIEDYSLVRFFPLNSHDMDSVGNIGAMFDDLMQYGEDVEPKDPKDQLLDEEEQDDTVGKEEDE